MSNPNGLRTGICVGEESMIQIGAKKTLERLDQMLTDAMNGTFEESRYD